MKKETVRKYLLIGGASVALVVCAFAFAFAFGFWTRHSVNQSRVTEEAEKKVAEKYRDVKDVLVTYGLAAATDRCSRVEDHEAEGQIFRVGCEVKPDPEKVSQVIIRNNGILPRRSAEMMKIIAFAKDDSGKIIALKIE